MLDAALITEVQNAFWHLAEDVLLHHTNPWELDEALEAFGYGTGPCLMQDHLGLDKVLARQPAPGLVLPRMVREGRIGKLGGVGFYRYPGGGGAVIDPLIEDLIREEAWFANIPRSELSDDATVMRMNDGLSAVCKGLPVPADWAVVLGQAVQFPPSKIIALGL